MAMDSMEGDASAHMDNVYCDDTKGLSLARGGNARACVTRPRRGRCWIDPLQDNVGIVILYVASVVLICYS